ncbi:conserved hypothetical protein [Histoplasma capsulatum H143]|uniref:Uncharacterized protein n=1 Tax=Ajellomyces capsulatus (strain H143) TaxID=544712 RepID=C6HSV0_AJECH|nr:conserved hypothetical protein [Histoplasma capsulatum H143]
MPDLEQASAVPIRVRTTSAMFQIHAANLGRQKDGGSKDVAKEYNSLKICIQTDNTESSPVLNELNMLHRLNEFIREDQPWLNFTLLARDILWKDAQIRIGGRLIHIGPRKGSPERKVY